MLLMNLLVEEEGGTRISDDDIVQGLMYTA